MRSSLLRGVSLLAAIGLAVGGVAAGAQTPTSTNAGQKKMEDRQEQRQERQGKLLEIRKTNIRRYFSQMIQRLQAHHDRLRQLADRIEARIKALDAQGAQTAAAKADLTNAKAAWQKAADAIAAAKAKLETLLSSEAPRPVFTELRQQLGLVRDHLKQTHRYLVSAITKIIGLRVGRPAGNVPTSTPTTTTP